MILTVTLNPARDEVVHVDGPGPYAPDAAGEREVFAGGKGYNVAKALASLGQPAVAAGFVGRADIDFFEDRLGRLGIQAALIPIARSRVNLKFIDRATGVETEMNEAGSPVTAGEVAALDGQIEAWLPRVDTLVLAGSAAPGVPAGFCGGLVHRARARGIRTLVDIRGEWLREAVEAVPFAVRVNAKELGEWAGEEAADAAAVRAAAGRMLASGVERVIVSRGAGAVVMVTAAGSWEVRPPALRAVNAVGCGDSMCAGLVTAWRKGEAPPADLEFGVAVASANVLTPEPGIVDPGSVQELRRLLDGHSQNT